MTDLDPLRPLLASRSIGPAVKLAFLDLWDLAGGRPGHVVTTAAAWASRLGRDARTARDWLDALAAADLVDVVDRSRRGVYQVYVYQPAPGQREERPDPQQRLPLAVEEDQPAQRTFPPEEPAETTKTPAGVSAQKPPRGFSQKRANPEENATNPPGVFVTHPPAKRRKPPRSPMDIEKDNLRLSHTHGTIDTMDHGRHVPVPFSATDCARIVEAAGTKAEQLRGQKEALVDYQARAVADSETDPSIYRRIAEAVYDHDAALEDVEHCAESVRSAREAGRIRASPGRLYLGMIRKRLPGPTLARLDLTPRTKRTANDGHQAVES